MSQQQMLETVVGGYKRQKRTFPLAYMEQPQRKWVAPSAFKRSLEEEYGPEAARIIGAGRWPSEQELEAELSAKLGSQVDIPGLAAGEILLGYEWTGKELSFTKTKASEFSEWLAYHTAYEKFPVEKYPATIDVISTTDPWGYKPVTSTERGYAEALDEQRFTEWVKAAKQVDIAPKTLTPEQLRAELQGQLPEGAELTYFFESKPGEYSVSYNLPHEEAAQTKIVRADMSGPFRDWLNWLATSPSAFDIGKDMTSGRAVPITTEEVFTASLIVASVAAPLLANMKLPSLSISEKTPLWLKNIPKAMYYEFVEPSFPYQLTKQGLGYVGQWARGFAYTAPQYAKAMFWESPLATIPRGVELARYYLPELAMLAQTSRPYMTAQHLWATGKEYAAVFQNVRSLYPITQRLQTSTPYMAVQYWREMLPAYATSSMPYMTAQYLKAVIPTYLKTSAPYMTLRSMPLLFEEAKMYAVHVAMPKLAELPFYVKTSMPYMTGQYLGSLGREYARELSFKLAYGLPSEFLKRGMFESGWFMGEELPTYIQRGLTALPDITQPIRGAARYAGGYAKGKLLEAEWLLGEFGKRGVYEAKWLAKYEIPTLMQRQATRLGYFSENLGLSPAIRNLKSEAYYLGEFAKRGMYEAKYPFMRLSRGVWKPLKYYLEHEVYKLPREYVLKPRYQGLQTTLGRVDLPYRGFMQKVTPSGSTFLVHPAGKEGLSLLTTQVTRTVATKTSTVLLPKLAVPMATVAMAKAWWQYRGKPYKSIFAMRTSVFKPTAKPYPVQQLQLMAYPTVKTERRARTRSIVFPSSKSIVTPLRDIIPDVGQPSVSGLGSIQAVSQAQSQIQKQMQRQSQKLKTPNIPKMRFEFPETKRKRRETDLFGQWYRRGHKIRTPVEAAGVFGFKLRKGKGEVHL